MLNFEAMAEFQPLLLEDLSLRLPQVAIRRICVNRHLPETNWVSAHQHDFEQLIVYLNGSGAQQVGDQRFVVVSGTVIAIPRAVRHAFIRENDRSRSPMCLVIDLEIAARDVAASLQAVTRLNASQMAELRRALLNLADEAELEEPNPLRQSAAILEITGVVLEASAALRPEKRSDKHRHLRSIDETLAEVPIETWQPALLATRMGFDHDVLNRALKRECGMTLGQLIAARRLDRAKQLLDDSGHEIQNVAAAIGIDDRNYFSRWFRRQTGLSPSEWRLQKFA